MSSIEEILLETELSDDANEGFVRFSLLVICYLEQKEVTPRRLDSEGRLRWRAYMKNLRLSDLLEMVVRDLSRSYPHLFAFIRRKPQGLWELRTLDDGALETVFGEIEKVNLIESAVEDLYALSAKLLDLQLPDMDGSVLDGLALSRNTIIAELPEGYGRPTLHLCKRYGILEPSHNFRIFTTTIEGEMLAAWALILAGGYEIPPEVVTRIDGFPIGRLSDETFDLALVYNPRNWLKENNLGTYIQAQRAIWL